MLNMLLDLTMSSGINYIIILPIDHTHTHTFRMRSIWLKITMKTEDLWGLLTTADRTYFQNRW